MNAVEKALTLLMAFQEDRPVWGVRALSTHLGFSPATVQRILQDLNRYGFVRQDPSTRQYRLGNVYFGFLQALQNAMPITQVAKPQMQWLLSQTQETVHLNVIDGAERLCIDTLESFQHLRASMPIGSRSPLYAGASSKCLLAFSEPSFVDRYLKGTTLKAVTAHTIADPCALMEELQTIRQLGYAMSLGERNPGLGSISAPLFNHTGTLLGAISLAIPEIRYNDPVHRTACLTSILTAAGRISKALGYR